MSTYIKTGKPLEYDNAPDWLVAYMRYCLAVKGDSRNTVMTYFIALRQFFQWSWQLQKCGMQPRTKSELQSVNILDMPLSAAITMRKNDIESYLYFLTDVVKNGPATRNQRLVAIRTFYDYLYDQQEALGIELLGNPAIRIPHPKTPKKQPVYLPAADQTALLENVTGENDVRDFAILLTLLATGMRISELVNLDVRDVNMDNATVRIRDGKGHKERIGYLSEPAIKALKDYLEQYRNLIKSLSTPALFVSRRNRDRLTTRAVQKIMKSQTLKARLGGMGYTPHKLRHTTASQLAKDGAPLLAIQEVLGHSSPTTTQIYTHLEQDDIAKAINSSSLAKLGGKPEI